MERQIKERHVFDKVVTHEWENFNAACSWCKENGYEYGSMSRPHPEIAIMKGEYNLPQKWKNMSTKEKKLVDGVIRSANYRNGIVEVIIYEQ